MGKKRLNELTIKDNFMFAAVMADSANCKPLLEMILDVPIDRVDVTYEKTIVYNPQYHGVRLDVYANDGKGTRYDIEMQVRNDAILKRSRYYHSQMDMDFLETNTDYAKLPKTYVIFICDYDPFGYGQYKYTQINQFKEVPGVTVDDGNHTIYLSTKGKNFKDIPNQLISFLDFVHASLDESCNDFHDPYVNQLQNAVARVKASREMGSRYMLLEILLREEREEGRLEGIQEGAVTQARQTLSGILDSLGSMDKTLSDTIQKIQSIDVLNQLILISARSTSIEEFEMECYKLISK